MLMKKIKAFLSNEKGAETVEWIAIAAIIVTLGGAAYNTAGISTTISAGLNAVSTAISSAG